MSPPSPPPAYVPASHIPVTCLYPALHRVMRWFEETQAPALRSPATGHFPDWFCPDILTQRQAKELLAHAPLGTFLVRICKNRFGFSLSVKTRADVRHLTISQLETGKYVVIGSHRVHSNLGALLLFHSKVCVVWCVCTLQNANRTSELRTPRSSYL